VAYQGIGKPLEAMVRLGWKADIRHMLLTVGFWPIAVSLLSMCELGKAAVAGFSS
jgi:hypothetical protein